MTIRWTRVLNELNKTAEPKFESTSQLLEYLYVTQHYSLSQLAELYECHLTTVRRKLLQLGIKLRHRGGNHDRTRIFITDEEFRTMSLKEIAFKKGCHISTVSKKYKQYLMKGGEK